MSVVEMEVVLVSSVLVKFFSFVYLRLVMLVFSLDSIFGSIFIEVIGDDGMGVLYVEEVRCKRLFGGVLIVDMFFVFFFFFVGSGNKVGEIIEYELGSGIVKLGE